MKYNILFGATSTIPTSLVKLTKALVVTTCPTCGRRL